MQWNRTEALQLFNALQKDQPVPAGLLTGTRRLSGTQVG